MLFVYCLVPVYRCCTCLLELILFWYVLYLFIRAGFVCVLHFYTIIDSGCVCIVVYLFTRDVLVVLIL